MAQDQRKEGSKMNTAPIQSVMVAILPDCPPPEPPPSPDPPPIPTMFLVVAYYEGPGWLNGCWSVRPGNYMTQEGAEAAANKLNRWYTHRQIVMVA